ncbi:MAG: hypothetical protein LUH05_08350 [Candidatus Gastranaerophilales bacterium]|nr:hypothetical protein [Candidatus Gastranaerophilales bacterium]
MKVQAVNSVMPENNCQSVRRAGILRKPQENNFQEPEYSIELSDDVYTPSDPYTTEQKYNLACQLAAYYKTQYEELAEGLGCIA